MSPKALHEALEKFISMIKCLRQVGLNQESLNPLCRVGDQGTEERSASFRVTEPPILMLTASNLSLLPTGQTWVSVDSAVPWNGGSCS